MRRWSSSQRTAQLILGVLVALALVAVAVGTAGCIPWPPSPSKTTSPVDGPQPSTPISQVPTAPAVVHERPIPPTGTAPLASATPEDAVRAWYLAWFAGDIDAAKRTSKEPFASQIDEHTFEGGDVIDYKILGTEGAAGTTAFYISETREGVAGKTPMMVLVSAADTGEGYLVKGYQDTQPGDKPAEAAPPDSKTAVNMLDAQAAVTETLRDLRDDKVPDAQALATARFVKANPRWFAPASGALLEFSIARVVRRHNVWVVQMAEKWRGEAHTLFVNYIVFTIDGDAKIDRVQGWY